ncbi:MAG: hypothetical protein WC517_00925 [Patescibacteria group bacterium]
MSSFEKIPKQNENPPVPGIAEFAQRSYLYEPGTKKAIDDGIISMRELEIYHCLAAWTNENSPAFSEDGGEEDYMATLEKAYGVIAKSYSIDEGDARRIFQKVNNIPTTLPKG